jgi:quercetin dioxygenase-like cupin family protein
MSKVNLSASPTEWGWSKIFAQKADQALESGIFCCESGKSLPLHTHAEGDEYCYLFKGAGVFVIDGQEIAAAEGDLIKIPRGVEHLSYPTGGDEFVSFYLICP